jgi:SAM-dependent methyltransferase
MSIAYNELHVWSLDEKGVLEGLKNSMYLKSISKEDKILDIGCGQGIMVKCLHELGYKVLGIDLNQELIDGCKLKGLPVVKIDALEGIKKFGSEYSVYSMLDFVEHVPIETFIDIMKEISSRPNSIVWLQTPNLDSLVGFKFWFHMPSHINAMHPFVLRGLLKRLDFEIVSEWTEYGELPWKGLRRKITVKFLNAVFGPVQARMFLEGGNICIIAKTTAK